MSHSYMDFDRLNETINLQKYQLRESANLSSAKQVKYGQSKGILIEREI